MPVVCLHPPGNSFWHEWHQYVSQTLLGQGMISPEDLSLYRITDSVEQAVTEILNFYRRFHSMRFWNDQLLLRLTAPLASEQLAQLNDTFSDIISDGSIEPSPPPQGDEYDPRLSGLAHLKFSFVAGRYGRLRQMIDILNDLPCDRRDVCPDVGEGGRMPVETDLSGTFPVR